MRKIFLLVRDKKPVKGRTGIVIHKFETKEEMNEFIDTLDRKIHSWKIM
jgi:hypothetical protein